MKKKFGLIGRAVSHSYSKAYFDEKFFREKLRDYHYELYQLADISGIKTLLSGDPEICGLNVTIPYKEQVLEFLDEIDAEAARIGAVNVIQIKDGKLKGFNTDSAAFYESLQHWLPQLSDQKALILGTGGSGKAVQEALTKLSIPYLNVSRDSKLAPLTYAMLKVTDDILDAHKLIINTTPLGMSPDTALFPDIPYEKLDSSHMVYDLIYNPARTQFLQKAGMRGCSIKNGLEMLHLQAEKSWQIWNS
ncbi:MAG: shikimate dehydrogenase family protein [Cyclobacteriaceae bacterium]